MAFNSRSNKAPLGVTLTTALVIGTFGAAVPIASPASAVPVLAVPLASANLASAVRTGTGTYRISLNLADALAGKVATVKLVTIVGGKSKSTTLGKVTLETLGAGVLNTTKKLAKGTTITVYVGGVKVLTKKLSSVKYVPGPTPLQAATSAVVDYESLGSDAAKSAATAKINQLPAGAEHDALQMRVDAKAALVATAVASATTLVAAFEANASDANKLAAQSAVTALPAGAGKDGLQARITAKSGTVTAAVAAATTAVAYYEATGTTTAKNDAQAAVTALPAGASKTALQARIDALPAAIALVVTYETTGASIDQTAAQAAVTALPAGVTKTDLQGRITLVTSVVAAVVSYETSPNALTKSSADAYVGLLSSGTLKTALTARVSLVAAALTAVVAFEAAGTVSTQDAATTAINALATGVGAKTSLLARVRTTAVLAVINAETTGNSVDITSATTTVNALSGSTPVAFKNALLTRLGNITAATAAVVAFEASGTLVDQTSATTAVGRLPALAWKTALTSRINTPAVNAVVAYEATGALADFTAASGALPVGTSTFKDGLQARIDAKVAALVTAATTLVATYEAVGSDANFTAANSAVNALPAGVAKTGLATRITTKTTAVAAAVTAATALVVTLEGSRLLADKTAAQTAVTALPDGAAKTALQTRITAVVLL